MKHAAQQSGWRSADESRFGGDGDVFCKWQSDAAARGGCQHADVSDDNRHCRPNRHTDGSEPVDEQEAEDDVRDRFTRPYGRDETMFARGEKNAGLRGVPHHDDADDREHQEGRHAVEVGPHPVDDEWPAEGHQAHRHSDDEQQRDPGPVNQRRPQPIGTAIGTEADRNGKQHPAQTDRIADAGSRTTARRRRTRPRRSFQKLADHHVVEIERHLRRYVDDEQVQAEGGDLRQRARLKYDVRMVSSGNIRRAVHA